MATQCCKVGPHTIVPLTVTNFPSTFRTGTRASKMLVIMYAGLRSHNDLDDRFQGDAQMLNMPIKKLTSLQLLASILKNRYQDISDYSSQFLKRFCQLNEFIEYRARVSARPRIHTYAVAMAPRSGPIVAIFCASFPATSPACPRLDVMDDMTDAPKAEPCSVVAPVSLEAKLPNLSPSV